MKVLRIVLLVYCMLAVLALAYLIAKAGMAAAAAGSAVESRSAELEEAVSDSRSKERTLTELQTEQRDNRLAYDGPRAVEMSLKVQLALEEYETASALRSQLEQEVQRVTDLRKANQIKLVPYIALLLLHLLGIAYFIRPPRQSIMPR